MHLPEVSAEFRIPGCAGWIVKPQCWLPAHNGGVRQPRLLCGIRTERRCAGRTACETNLQSGVLGSYASPIPWLGPSLWTAWRLVPNGEHGGLQMLAILGMASLRLPTLIFLFGPSLLYTLPAWILGWVLHRSIRLTATYLIAAAAPKAAGPPSNGCNRCVPCFGSAFRDHPDVPCTSSSGGSDRPT